MKTHIENDKKMNKWYLVIKCLWQQIIFYSLYVICGKHINAAHKVFDNFMDEALGHCVLILKSYFISFVKAV